MTQTELAGEERPLTWDEIGCRKPKTKWIEDELLVIFKTDRPVEMPSKFDGRQLWLFDVNQEGEERVFFTSSVRLARALKSLGDLRGKQVRILRRGKGMSLQYSAEVVV